MAIDSRNKRASILGLAVATTLALPVPNGSIVVGDRQQVAFCYAGALNTSTTFALADLAIHVGADDAAIRVRPDEVVVQIAADPAVQL